MCEVWVIQIWAISEFVLTGSSLQPFDTGNLRGECNRVLTDFNSSLSPRYQTVLPSIFFHLTVMWGLPREVINYLELFNYVELYLLLRAINVNVSGYHLINTIMLICAWSRRLRLQLTSRTIVEKPTQQHQASWTALVSFSTSNSLIRQDVE